MKGEAGFSTVAREERKRPWRAIYYGADDAEPHAFA